MSSLDQNGQLTVLKQTLSSCQDLFTNYRQILGTQGTAITNTGILTKKRLDLHNALDALKMKVDAMDLEYTDRSAVKTAPERPDLILIIFYGSYILFALFVSLMIGYYSIKKIQDFVASALFFIILGVMITGVIKYFA